MPLIAGFTLIVWGLVRSAQQAPLAWAVPAGLLLVIFTLVMQRAPIAAGLTGMAGLIPFWYGLGQPATVPARGWAQIHPWLLVTLALAAAA